MLNLNLLKSLRQRNPGRRQRKSPLAFGERLETRSMLTRFVVTSTEDAPDTDPGDGVAATAAGEVTLRAAIEEANAASGVDSIEIPAGFFEPIESLEVTEEVRLRGAGSGETVLDASQVDSLFAIEAGTTLRLEDLSLAGQEETEEGIQPDGGIVELSNVTQSKLPAGSVTHELLDRVELFLLDLAEAEAEDEAAAESFPLNTIEPLRSSPHHGELLETLFDTSTLNPLVQLPLFESRLAEPPPISQSDILLGSGPVFIEVAEAEGEAVPIDGSLSEQEATKRDGKRTAKNDPEVPRDSATRRKEVINSLFEKPDNEAEKIKQTSGELPESEATKQPPHLPLSPVPLGEDGELLLKPAEPNTERLAPPPLPEPADQAETSAVDVDASYVAAGSLLVVPAGWRQRWRKRLRYWRAVVS